MSTQPVTALKVTVILPARNVASVVDETLESLFAQTRLPDEIVVADGRSTDATVERVRRFETRGVPLRVVENPSLFAGGGRNAATREASHEILANMDFGNTADPRWLESLILPFQNDPDLALVGGLFTPLASTPFERICAALFYLIDLMVPTMDRALLQSKVHPDYVPGGMCLAYRRSAWQAAGGFSEWARKGQDVLFGRRVRRVGSKIGITFDAMIRHHMASSLRQITNRHFYYELWGARVGIRSKSTTRLILGVVVAALVTLTAAAFTPWALLALAPIALAYAAWRSTRKLLKASKVTGLPFTLRDHVVAVGVLVAHDAACVAGRVIGEIDGLVRPSWRARTRRYLEDGA